MRPFSFCSFEPYQIPKPGGVRKGWQRQYAIICDFKIFFHDVVDNKVSPSATLVFDMRYGHILVYLNVSYCMHVHKI